MLGFPPGVDAIKSQGILTQLWTYHPSRKGRSRMAVLLLVVRTGAYPTAKHRSSC
jgi:hypothetical protein